MIVTAAHGDTMISIEAPDCGYAPDLTDDLCRRVSTTLVVTAVQLIAETQRQTDMPRAPRICSQPGCPRHAGANARCQQHQPTPWANTTRLSTRHQSWRRAVLNRDDWTCQHCGGPP